MTWEFCTKRQSMTRSRWMLQRLFSNETRVAYHRFSLILPELRNHTSHFILLERGSSNHYSLQNRTWKKNRAQLQKKKALTRIVMLALLKKTCNLCYQGDCGWMPTIGLCSARRREYRPKADYT